MSQKTTTSFLSYFWKYLGFLSLSFLFILGNTSTGWSQEVQKQLETKISFESNGSAKITYNKHDKSIDETTTNQLQSALLFYGYGMNALDQEKRMTFLNGTQKIVFQVASEEGLKRADILKGNALAKIDENALKAKGFDLTFGAIANQGNTLEVKELGEKDPNVFIPATFWLFQDMIKNMPENGLRFFILALGATNKWYRDNKDKIGEPSSIAAASSHGLKTAAEIMEAVAGAGKGKEAS